MAKKTNTEIPLPPFIARASTLVVRPKKVQHHPDIALLWQPSRGGVTASGSDTRLFLPRRFFRRLKGKGAGRATIIASPRKGDEHLAWAYRDEHDPGVTPTHVAVRVVERAPGCSLTRVMLPVDGRPMEKVTTIGKEIFVAPIGTIVSFAFSDGRTHVVRLDATGAKETKCSPPHWAVIVAQGAKHSGPSRAKGGRNRGSAERRGTTHRPPHSRPRRG